MKTKIYAADVSPLENEDLFFRLYSLVSDYRKSKVDSLLSDGKKRLSLGAGALLKAALAAEGVYDYTVITEKNGKPKLWQRDDIRFSISHSGSKVMCVLSDCDVGCDVEKIRNIDANIAKRFFSPEEYHDLMRCADDKAVNDLFFRYWTLKESFIKTLGRGLSLPLNSFCIRQDGESVSVRQEIDSRQYSFCEFGPYDGYRYAVCVAGGPEKRAGEINFVSF
jgi:4'-phosphopantetheinyl transferase